MNRYRVFISYSHEDKELVENVVGIIEENNLNPMWDKNFAYGYGFHEQIKTFISHAHVFLPVITESSYIRGWVHQEIGYAMALNVPVLPVSLGPLPGEMLQQLHAIKLGETMQERKKQLSIEVFENLINRYRDLSLARYQCAELAEDRAIMMARYATNVIELGATGCVRQKGALSSFHIPDKVISDPTWKKRYGPVERSPYHCRLQREERLALGKHARGSGCRIIINPSIEYKRYGPEARKIRLETLLNFLSDMPDDKVQVAINEQMQHEESVTIVGDWFAAESVSASIGQGYRQTIFTKHAPSMWSRVELFDQEFESHLQKSRWKSESSRKAAIDELKRIISAL